MLDTVWQAVGQACGYLQQEAGLEVQYAQSTYLHKNAKNKTTRRTAGFSVDTTLTDGVRTVWVEAQWSELADLRKAVPTATGKLQKYVDAAAEEEKAGGTWQLDAKLGGGALKQPTAFATLVFGERGFRLDFYELFAQPLCVDFGRAAEAQQPAEQRQRASATATQKRHRQKALRASNRASFQQPPVPVLVRKRVLKKPAQVLGGCILEAVV